jgi:hypothetical protein
MSMAAHGVPSALIVSGLGGSPDDNDAFQREAGETRRLLIERGFPAASVTMLTDKVTRVEILRKLAEAEALAPADEFWLVLFGHSGAGQGGQPAFQVSGPRLTAADLQTALGAIPARQYVFIGTNGSGAFLAPLQSAQRNVLTATKGTDEDDQPRFPDEWINAFGENPQASFARIAARAAQLTDAEYQNNSLAQSEHARLADATTGTILEPPFGVDLTVKDTKTADAGTDAETPFDLKDLTLKPVNPNAMWEERPPTAETKKLIAEAQAAPNPDGDSAIMLEQRLRFTVRADRMTEQTVYYRVYVPREEAVEDWANCELPQSAPAVTTKLLIARVINPDGSSTVFNPAKLLEATDPTSGESSGTAMIYLPNAHAGCVVEMSYRTLQILDSTIPAVSESLVVQRGVPILKTALEVRVPERPVFRVKLNNATGTPAETTEDGRRVFRWQLGALGAAYHLPGDPPPPQWVAWLAVSSLPSWDEFAAWYRRLAQGSDVIDDSVRKMAAQLAAGAKTRLEKIRHDFEFVAALRYVAIEIGVQGFRPRTPGQVLANRYGDCKDKANLVAALLRCQGIDARFVLLNRGGYTDVNFPSWQFNHAIAFVPAAPQEGQAQDLWLDTTDSVTPFGSVPPGDFGRAGLVFSNDQAEFKTVTGATAASSETRDDWTLEEAAQGGWQGSFHRVATGFADDGLRRNFRSLAPVQRQTQLYGMLAELWPLGDFSAGEVSDTSALNQPMELRAKVSAPAGDLPEIGRGVLAYFTSPARNRPLLLNDGQPVLLTQTLRLHYFKSAPDPLPAPFQAALAGEKLSVRWERVDEHTLRRTARLELANGLVPAADYAALRQALRGWNAAIAR